MHLKRLTVILIAHILLCTAPWLEVDASASIADTWRSSLYPVDWSPNHQDQQGRFLQDFSFAGYHGGERPIGPDIVEPVVIVTEAPYLADPTGHEDATASIQAAIDDIGQQGGGTVYLPPGTYRLRVPAGSQYALGIPYSNVRLVGAGPDKTFLFLETYSMRSKNMIHVFGEGNWRIALPGSTQHIAADLTYPTQIIPLDGTPRFAVGDWVVLTHDTTQEWIDEHNMGDLWPTNSIVGATFYRQVIAVDKETNTITIDAPIRYYLLPRDNARVYKVGPHVAEVGLANFSLGMAEHPGVGWGGEDYTVRGTGAWDVHESHAIRFDHVVNSWIRNVHTYRPEGNEKVHILSNGVLLNQSRYVTLEGLDFRNPQYLGGGGNGYLVTFIANDSLLIDSRLIDGRHNISFKTAYANGNVVTSSYSRGIFGHHSDFHMHLSPSNLIDNVTLDQDRIDAGWRSTWGTIPHGLTTTQTVIWNVRGERYGRYPSVVYSEQYGWGYIIGTQGSAAEVLLGRNERTLPVDYVEGVGEGAHLEPQSLYTDQLERRLARSEIVHSPELDFRPQLPVVKVLSPYSGQVVTGELTIELDVKLADGVSIAELTITVDGEELYSGPWVDSLSLDTLTLADGEHELLFTVRDTNGRFGLAARPFAVDNWYTLTDELQPPLQTGLFGTLDRSRTSSQSAGWKYATSDAQAYFGDADRLVPASGGERYLVWEAQNLKAFRVVVYGADPSVAKTVMVQVSADGESWQALPHESVTEGPSSGGVYLVELVGTEVTGDTAWFRLLVSDHATDRHGLQLGLVELRGLKTR